MDDKRAITAIFKLRATGKLKNQDVLIERNDYELYDIYSDYFTQTNCILNDVYKFLLHYFCSCKDEFNEDTEINLSIEDVSLSGDM